MLKPFRKALSCLPWMNYEEQSATNNEHEMRDLLSGQDVERKVMIGGREVIKRHADNTKR